MIKTMRVVDILTVSDTRPVSPHLAKTFGINEAHILHQVAYWVRIATTGRQENNYRDGFYWVYKTADDLSAELPWLTNQHIARLLRRLRKMKLLVATDKYNRKRSDRTLWYRVNDAVEADIVEVVKKKKKH